jgi:hypothetical protein
MQINNCREKTCDTIKARFAAICVSIAGSLYAAPTYAVERYTDARISQVETSDNGIILFLQEVSGDAPLAENVGSNEALAKPYLILASTPADVAARQHLLANAFVAFTQGSLVRFRWEDAGSNAGRIMIMLVRN